MLVTLIATNKRLAVTKQSIATWQKQGWEVVVEWNDGQHLVAARNRILKRFYESNDKWCAMADDDCILDEHKGDVTEFIQNPIDVLNKCPPHISTVIPMNPIHQRIAYTHRQPIYKTHWRFERDTMPHCKIAFHRQTGKHFWQKTMVLQDLEWGLHQYREGYVTARLNNIVLTERQSDKSTIFKDKKDRVERYKKAKQWLVGEYPELYFSSKQYLLKSKFMKKYATQQTATRFVDCLK
jgi:hypothetical protein